MTSTEPARERTGGAASVVAALLLSIVAAGAVGLCAALFPDRLPAPGDPDVIDLVFDSRPVVWAARLLLVSAAFVLAVGGAYVVASTVVRMRNGDWLRRAGPFEVAETVAAELEDQVHFWRSAALDCYDELERIQAQADDDDARIEHIAHDTEDDRL